MTYGDRTYGPDYPSGPEEKEGEERMTEKELAEILRERLEGYSEDGLAYPIDIVKTFEETGLLTSNEGVVVRLTNGEEFQVTVVQSR